MLHWKTRLTFILVALGVVASVGGVVGHFGFYW